MHFKMHRANFSMYSIGAVIFILNFASHACFATNIEEELRITYNQKLLVDKLRQRVLPKLTESYMKDDLYMVRWLRAANFDLEKAQRNLLQSLKWRKENKIATIHEEDFSDLGDEFPYMLGTDKQGQPTFYAFAGEWDIRGAVLTGRAPRVIRYITQVLDGATKWVRELQYSGKNVTRLNLIIDLDGFNVVQHTCVQCLLRILDFLFIYDNNYPGMADRVIFVNTPPTVAVALELVRNNANAVTFQAIKLYGMDRTVWQKALLGFIDRDQLPVDMGGTKKRS